MQPEPNETSQKDPLKLTPPDTPPSLQHGFYDTDHQPLQQPHAGGGEISPRSSTLHRGSSHASSEVSGDSLRKIKSKGSRTGSPSDRISEHEKALTHAPRKGGIGPAFTVVQRATKDRATGICVEDFPNEVLTYILSHLPPSSLSNVSSVSKRFHRLVTTPHAWRSAFSRFFPGAEALATIVSTPELCKDGEALASDRRVFSRLTALASWRSEYILRTRLLRSLKRGKPLEAGTPGTPVLSRQNAGQSANAQITYSSNLTCPVNHIHASFGTSANKAHPRFMHGSDEIGMASASDPRLGRVDSWGFQDTFGFRQFSDLFPGQAEYGLGTGDIVGVPNSMDVSQLFGMVYGEGHGHESILWFRHTGEKRGRALIRSTTLRQPKIGVPLLPDDDAVCCVWIAKSRNLPDLTEGLIGILAGTSTGVLTAYSLGTNGVRNQRLERGEITARWALSPGVPIIGICVDEQISTVRIQSCRIWAVVLNALGELYYLTELPVHTEQGEHFPTPHSSPQAKSSLERMAWATGRTVQWKLAEPTRRIAKVDPFERSDIHGSYSPQSSSHRQHLSGDELVAETAEIEKFLREKPKHFRKICYGWDMRRRLEVDFAATGNHNAGEVVVVMSCGLEDGTSSEIKRYIRHKAEARSPKGSETYVVTTNGDPNKSESRGEDGPSSVFGGVKPSSVHAPSWSFTHATPVRRGSLAGSEEDWEKSFIEEWRTSNLTISGPRQSQITASALNSSLYATLTAFEDPLLSLSSASSVSSPMSSPLASMPGSGRRSDIPGDRARLLAIGMNGGTVLVYNVRSAAPVNAMIENSLEPLRIISTDSPQISCVALTALYLVHGGNDGLVQAWDLLASSTEPIRTINSRFSSRARRRLVQAAASPAGVGLNLFAAGAICLDPDPTLLRGMVSLGSQLRYWGYSSNGADQYKGSKRRHRRSERGSNQGADRFTSTCRGTLRDYIAKEKLDLEREKREKCKEGERLAGRFGLDLLGPGASDDEIMAYATMLSEEAAEDDKLRRKSSNSGSDAAPSPIQTQTYPESVDEELAEAMQVSLQDASWDSGAGSSSLPIKVAKRKKAGLATETHAAPVSQDDDGDLEYAIQLSLTE